MSKTAVNKTTAKAALTQMISIVNQRMEIQDALLKSKFDASANGIPINQSELENEDISR